MSNIDGSSNGDGSFTNVIAEESIGLEGKYIFPLDPPANANDVITSQLGSNQLIWSEETGLGNVIGPASSVNNNVVLFGDNTGKLIKDSGLPIADVAKNPNVNNAVNNTAPTYTFDKTRAGGAVLAGDRLGDILFKGNDGVETFTGARIETFTIENATPGNHGTGILIGATAEGETNLTTQMTFLGDKLYIAPIQGLQGNATNPTYGFLGRDSGINNDSNDVLIIHNQVERLRVKFDGVDVKEKLSIVDEFDAKKWDYELEGDNLSLVNKDGIEFVKHVAGGLSIFRRNVKIEGDNVIIGNGNVDTPRILFENTVSNPAFQIAVVEDNNTMEFLDENNDPVMVLTHNGPDRDTKIAQDLLVGSVDLLDNNDPSSQLELLATNKGFLPNRLTEAERDAIATPAKGLIIFNTTTDKLNLYTDVWTSVQGGGDESVLTLLNSDNNIIGAQVNLEKERGPGGQTLLGDRLGSLRFYGTDQLGGVQFGASIEAVVAETVGTTDSNRGATLAFRSTAEGSSTPIVGTIMRGSKISHLVPLEITSGSNITPSYSFTSYPSSGLHANSSSVKTSVNGVDVIEANATKIILNAPAVQVGTGGDSWDLVEGLGTDGAHLISNGAGSSRWETRSYAHSYATDNSASTIINTANVYTQIIAVRTLSPLSNDFDITLNQTRYLASETKKFEVNVSWSWEHTGGSGQLFTMAIFKTGVLVPGSEIRSQLDDNNVYPRSASSCCIVELEINDSVELYVKCNTATTNVLIQDVAMVISQV